MRKSVYQRVYSGSVPQKKPNTQLGISIIVERIRFIEKNHKIGAAEKTMQSGLAKAFFLHFTKDNQES